MINNMPRQRVNLDEVTMTALMLIDRESLSSLTLSAVAAHLGVRPSALYTYFDSLEALRHAVAVQATVNLTEYLRDAAIGQSGNATQGNCGHSRSLGDRHGRLLAQNGFCCGTRLQARGKGLCARTHTGCGNIGNIRSRHVAGRHNIVCIAGMGAT